MKFSLHMYATCKTHFRFVYKTRSGKKKFIELWAPGSNFKTEEHWVSHCQMFNLSFELI